MGEATTRDEHTRPQFAPEPGMDLPPALTVITQALLALVFGFLGLMVAVPMLATVLVIVQVLYVQKRSAPAGARAPSSSRDLDESLEPGLP